jgi:hypothetical protein
VISKNTAIVRERLEGWLSDAADKRRGTKTSRDGTNPSRTRRVYLCLPPHCRHLENLLDVFSVTTTHVRSIMSAHMNVYPVSLPKLELGLETDVIKSHQLRYRTITAPPPAQHHNKHCSSSTYQQIDRGNTHTERQSRKLYTTRKKWSRPLHDILHSELIRHL